jgi:hypothetical protein
VRNILAVNKIRIDDGVTTSKTLTQTNGVLQADTLSPLLFNLTTADALHEQNTKCLLYLYADDMMIAAREKNELQRAFNKLQKWAKQNEYKINKKGNCSHAVQKERKNCS